MCSSFTHKRGIKVVFFFTHFLLIPVSPPNSVHHICSKASVVGGLIYDRALLVKPHGPVIHHNHNNGGGGERGAGLIGCWDRRAHDNGENRPKQTRRWPHTTWGGGDFYQGRRLLCGGRSGLVHTRPHLYGTDEGRRGGSESRKCSYKEARSCDRM